MTTRRQFFGFLGGAAAAAAMPVQLVPTELSAAAQAWKDGTRFFKDIAGTIPCQPGDTVALLVNTWADNQTILVQPEDKLRPVYGKNKHGMGYATFDGTRTMVNARFGQNVKLHSLFLSSSASLDKVIDVENRMMKEAGIKCT